MSRVKEVHPASNGIPGAVDGQLAVPVSGRTPQGKAAAAGNVEAKEPEELRSARLEALAALLRDAQSSGDDAGLQHYSDVLGQVSRLSGDDFPQLFRLMEYKDKLDPESTLLPLLRWAGEDPEAALAYALSREEFKDSERVISALMYQLAKTDLPAAKALLARFPEKSEEFRDARRAIVKALLLANPKEALAYAREIKDPNAEAMVLRNWARAEPLAAAEELVSADPALQPALSAIAGNLLVKDRAAFDAWAASLTDPVSRNTVRGIALSHDTLTDPAKAAQDTAEWLASDPAAAASAGELPVSIAQRWWWAKAPPSSVADWATSLPAGPAQNRAVGEVARLWVKEDTVAASGWIDGLAAGPGRDTAVSQLFWAIQKEAPDDAFAWAATIQDASVRRNLLTEFMMNWASKDPGAAMSAVETLPIEHRGELQEIISKTQSAAK